MPRGSVVLAVTTLGSYVLGLLRDRTLAQTFGAGAALDSYNAAFLVPDFLFNFLVASGIAAAAVPLFTELQRRDRQQAYEYMNGLLSAAMTVMAVSGVIVFMFAPFFSSLVVPGLGGEARVMVVQLMRILAIPPLLFAASNALGSMLIAQQRFLFYGLSPMVYNSGIIAGALLLAPRWGIVGVAWGTVVGAGLHLLVRLIDAVRSGWRLKALWHWHTPEMKRTLRLMVPKMVGHPVELVTFGVFTSIASWLVPGSIAVLGFARNFQSVPVSVIGIAMATAVFPALAQAALVSHRELKTMFWRTALSIFAVSALAALVMFMVRRPLVAMLLGGGAFDAPAVAQTALVLGVFCLAIPTESLSHLVARAFYATQNTVIPVTWSVVSLAVAASSAYVLAQTMGIIGLPLGFFLGSLAKTLGLMAIFWRRTRDG